MDLTNKEIGLLLGGLTLLSNHDNMKNSEEDINKLFLKILLQTDKQQLN